MLKGKSSKKIIVFSIILIFLSPTFLCSAKKPKNDENLIINNPLSEHIVSDLVIDDDKLFVNFQNDLYIFNIANKERPRKQSVIESIGLYYTGNIISYQNKLLIFSRSYSPSIRNHLFIYDVSNIRKPTLVKELLIIDNLTQINFSYLAIENNQELVIFQMLKNGTKIFQLTINMETYENTLQIINAETIFEENVTLWGIEKVEDKVYFILCDENNTLGLGICTIQDDFKLIKEQVFKSNDNESIYNIDTFIQKNYFIIKWFSADFGMEQRVYDFSNGKNLTNLETLKYEDIGFIEVIDNNIMYVTNHSHFNIYNISDWENRELIGSFDCGVSLGVITLTTNYAYINLRSYYNNDFLGVLKISDYNDIKMVKVFGIQLLNSETLFVLVMIGEAAILIIGVFLLIATPVVIIRLTTRKRKKDCSSKDLINNN